MKNLKLITEIIQTGREAAKKLHRYLTVRAIERGQSAQQAER